MRIGGGFAALAALSGTVLVATDSSGRIGTTVNDTLVASYGPIVGASYDIDDAWRIGLAFRGTLEGRFNVVITVMDLGTIMVPPLNISGVAQYDPWQIALEVARARGPWKFAISATYKHWSAYPGLAEPTVRCPTTDPTTGMPFTGPCNVLTPPAPGYHDTVVPRAGVERSFAPAPRVDVHVRGGAFFEPSPAPAQTQALEPLRQPPRGDHVRLRRRGRPRAGALLARSVRPGARARPSRQREGRASVPASNPGAPQRDDQRRHRRVRRHGRGEVLMRSRALRRALAGLLAPAALWLAYRAGGRPRQRGRHLRARLPLGRARGRRRGRRDRLLRQLLQPRGARRRAGAEPLHRLHLRAESPHDQRPGQRRRRRPRHRRRPGAARQASRRPVRVRRRPLHARHGPLPGLALRQEVPRWVLYGESSSIVFIAANLAVRPVSLAGAGRRRRLPRRHQGQLPDLGHRRHHQRVRLPAPPRGRRRPLRRSLPPGRRPLQGAGVRLPRRRVPGRDQARPPAHGAPQGAGQGSRPRRPHGAAAPTIWRRRPPTPSSPSSSCWARASSACLG